MADVLTLDKSKIGKEDLELQTDDQPEETFTVTGPDGSLLTLTKIAGDTFPWTNAYTRTIRPKDIITKSPWVDVRAFGAKGDGVTDDTAAIQKAIDSADTGSYIYFPDYLTFKMGLVTISKSLHLCGKSTILLSGSGASFKLSGTITNFSAEDLTINGDAVVANAQKGFWCETGQAISNVLLENLIIKDVTQGIAIDDITNEIIKGCRISNCVGTAAGEGYGIHVRAKNATIQNNIIEGAQRAGIYLAYANNINIIGNVLKENSGDSALAVARGCSDVSIVGNIFDSNDVISGAINVASTTGEGLVERVAIVSNVFKDQTNEDLQLGMLTPSATDNIRGITVSSNIFKRSPANTVYSILILSGLNIKITGNQFLADNNYASNYVLIFFYDDNAAYIDRIIFTNNYVVISGPSGGERALSLQINMRTGTSGLFIKNNIFDCDTPLYAGEITNPNIIFEQTIFKKDVSLTLGLGGAWGPEEELKPSPTWTLSCMPKNIKITAGGTFGAAEIVTTRITAYYFDETSVYLSKQHTATGDIVFDNDDLASLLSNGKTIKYFGAMASTNQATTNVTINVSIAGGL